MPSMKLAAIYLSVGAENRKSLGVWYGTPRGSMRWCGQTLESSDSRARGVLFPRFSQVPAHHRDISAQQQTSSDSHFGDDPPGGPCATARAESRTPTRQGASRPVTP